MLSGKKKKDYAAESAAQALAAQAAAMGMTPDESGFTTSALDADGDEDDDESEITTEEELVAA